VERESARESERESEREREIEITFAWGREETAGRNTHTHTRTH
jgi:hypothetical protein